MDDALGRRAGVAERVHMRHDVVAELVLVLGSLVIVDVVDVRSHLLNLLRFNRQPQLHLTLGQRDPQLAPGSELRIIGKDFLHLAARVTRAQGIDINTLIGHSKPPF